MERMTLKVLGCRRMKLLMRLRLPPGAAMTLSTP